MLTKDPIKRPTIEDLLMHPSIKASFSQILMFYNEEMLAEYPVFRDTLEKIKEGNLVEDYSGFLP